MNKKTVTKLKSFLVTVCSMAVVLSFSIAVPYASEIDENEDITLKQLLPGSQKSADYPYQAFKRSF